MLPKNKIIDWKNNLYNHQPDESVWAKIEENLDFQILLDRQLAELPMHKPDDKVWERIAANLPKNKKIVFRYKIISIAASIAAIMALSTFILLTNNENKHTTTALTPISESNMEQEAIAQIRTYCTANTSACEQGNFKELMQLYDELKTEETELKKAMHQLGDSPEMIQAMIKIENLKSETIQDMILLIQS